MWLSLRPRPRRFSGIWRGRGTTESVRTPSAVTRSAAFLLHPQSACLIGGEGRISLPLVWWG